VDKLAELIDIQGQFILKEWANYWPMWWAWGRAGCTVKTTGLAEQ